MGLEAVQIMNDADRSKRRRWTSDDGKIGARLLAAEREADPTQLAALFPGSRVQGGGRTVGDLYVLLITIALIALRSGKRSIVKRFEAKELRQRLLTTVYKRSSAGSNHDEARIKKVLDYVTASETFEINILEPDAADLHAAIVVCNAALDLTVSRNPMRHNARWDKSYRTYFRLLRLGGFGTKI